MHDPRIDKLANLLLDHSCEIKSGETVLIEAIDLPEPSLVCALVEGAAARGATPLVTVKDLKVLRSLYRTATEKSMRLAGELERNRMERVQAYIGVRGSAQLQPARRRAARADGPLPAALAAARQRAPGPQDQVGRAPLPDRLVRPGGRA